MQPLSITSYDNVDNVLEVHNNSGFTGGRAEQNNLPILCSEK